MNKKFKILLAVLLVIVAIAIVIMAIIGWALRSQKPAFLFDLIKGESSDYYLVYVNSANGNVSYYGQLKENEYGQIILSNPGYIEIQQSEEKDGQPKIILRLMKDDFYQPVNEMILFKQNVIFMQKLESTSPVIAAYKSIK